MVAVTEAWKAWQEGLANKDSSKIGEFFTDDFQFIRPAGSSTYQEELGLDKRRWTGLLRAVARQALMT